MGFVSVRRLSRDYHVFLYIYVCMCVMSRHDFCKRDGSGDPGTMETTVARREQIKRDLQRAHDLVLLTLDVLMHSMKYD